MNMLGLLIAILLGGLFGYLAYIIAFKISKDQTIAGIIGLLIFLAVLFMGWQGGFTF